MSENELRQNVSRNIVNLRKRCDMTQSVLAEKLSYSDKSVSKWERGDGLPDIFVLCQLAELFGVTVNDLISEQNYIEKAHKTHNSHNRHILLTSLATGLVWFVATLLFFFLKIFMPDTEWLWMTFIYAIPVSAIVVVVFAHIWAGTVVQALSVSALVWGGAVCVHITAIVPDVQNRTLIYAAAAAFQVLVILWYLYLRTRRNKSKTEDVDETIKEEKLDIEKSSNEKSD